MKRLKRGLCTERLGVWKKIPVSIVQWLDNTNVLLASTFAGQLPMDSVSQYDKKSKCRINVDRPYVVQEYNKHVGGVNLVGSYIKRNRISMKSMKWYMRMAYHLVDLAISNFWLLFLKKHPDIPITLPKF